MNISSRELQQPALIDVKEPDEERAFSSVNAYDPLSVTLFLRAVMVAARGNGETVRSGSRTWLTFVGDFL